MCYMAPERVTGHVKSEYPELNKRTDIWSLGVIIYVLFSGKLPYTGDTCQDLYDQIKKCDLQFEGSEWKEVP